MIGVRSFARCISCSVPSASFRSSHSDVRLTASPKVALNDVAPRIRVEGLAPKTPVTLRAELIDDKGKQLLSNAHYVSDEKGVVEVMKDVSVGGSYLGIFPTGLLSSLKLVGEGQFEYGRVYRDDIHIPLTVKLNLYEGHESLTTKKEALDSVSLKRLSIGPGVKRYVVKGENIRGSMFIPAGEGPHPVVIDMHGAVGLLQESRAAMTASRGVASLCLPYFNYEDIPAGKLFHLELEYFEEAVDFVTSQPDVIQDRCGVFANCLGAFIGHHMMFNFEKVKALFAISFPLRSFGLFTYKEHRISGGDVYANQKLLEPNSEGLHCPIEEFKVMINKFEDNFIDTLTKSTDHKHFAYAIGEGDCYDFMRGLKNIKDEIPDIQNRISIKTYPKAGHLFDAPYSRTVLSSFMKMPYHSESTGNITFQDVVHSWGGDDQSNVKMQEGVWADVFPFFFYHLRDQSPWYQEWLLSQTKSQIN